MGFLTGLFWCKIKAVKGIVFFLTYKCVHDDGDTFTSPQDMKEHMEEIKTYMRGHNLFDIFYGRYKKEEKDLLKKYIEIAPRDEFSDILDAADSFIYFQSKTKQKDIQNETK